MKFIHRKIQKQPKWTQIIIVFFVILFVITGMLWFGATRWYDQNIQPVSSSTESVVVVIPSGSSTIEIADILSEAGLLRSTTAFNWYVDRLEDARLLQAGTYNLSSNLSVSEIVEVLLSGKVDTSLVTIPPGLRLDQIASALTKAGFDKTEVNAALEKVYDHPLINQKPKNASLEGYVFPETYQINAQTTAESLVKQSFSVFTERIDADITQGLARQGLTLHEGIILASIVQEEVSSPEEQKKVAQVFLRRLDEGFPLGADPTFRYAAAITGEEATPDLDSPYNTRIVTGLPPGPIGNFNLSALQAVANPANTDFLYFVAGDDGITRFSKTFEEHQRLIDKYCIDLCKL